MGTEWDIIEKTTRLLEAQKENPRFILNAGCALPAITPEKNLRAFVKTGREFERR